MTDTDADKSDASDPAVTPAASDARVAELAGRLTAVRERLAAARSAAGRDDEVELVVVTKFHPASDVVALVGLGVHRVGENRAQEAAAKAAELAAVAEAGDAAGADESDAAGRPAVGDGVRPPLWDMIGHIQSNKAAAVARWADRVQSVDSVRVADGLDRGRGREVDEGRRTGPLPVLLQLSVDGDTARGGVTAAELAALAEHVAECAHLRLDGLMVVPPLEGDADRHLATATRVWDGLRAGHPGATVFSAGMSGDLESAVAAGSTCVRVGTAILGPRPIA